MTFREKLATNLRRLREERGLSQEEFAELADLHRTYISMIERQTRNPTVDVLEKICLALGVELGDLFK
ncbi:MAG: helix-turn-helix transcriptional regulator [Alphaproteobacteria bacterium]|nr:helix-turn-helix transcriptional regulator [Alphaproteobacteria bacterium]MBU0864728.1 helix-turn-helix transcriptional regulator [Alphaproteobacteria bacterium]MBU1826103.1 helix-turn-helix transcriptional regulator [Alphaproteobacteria bacterium]